MQAVDTSERVTGIRRKLWTRDEAARLAEMFPGERYELIEGELINKMGQNPPHAYVIAVLTKIFGAAFSGRIRVQSSITLPDPEGQYSEPEPDIVLLHTDDPEFFGRHPGPKDIALLIEVADTTFAFDRSTKYRLYARAGIQEYWIVDIPNRRAVVCRTPQGDDYRLVTIFSEQETISPASEPEFSLQISKMFA
jgi:Uma2 family endonuclease